MRAKGKRREAGPRGVQRSRLHPRTGLRMLGMVRPSQASLLGAPERLQIEGGVPSRIGAFPPHPGEPGPEEKRRRPSSPPSVTTRGRLGLARCFRALLFHAIESEGLEEWNVLEREQDGRHGAGVGVLMRGPWRHGEEIALTPVEGDTVDDGAPRAADDVVDSARGLSVCAGADAGAEHLEIAAEGGDDRSA